MPHSIFRCDSHDALLSVASGRFARGTVLVASHFLYKANEQRIREWKMRNGKLFVSVGIESSGGEFLHLDELQRNPKLLLRINPDLHSLQHLNVLVCKIQRRISAFIIARVRS